MLDNIARQKLSPRLGGIAGKLIAANIKPNTLTIAGFAAGNVACLCVALGWFVPGLVFVLLGRAFHVLAGATARATEITDLGILLDVYAEFYIYAAFVFFFSLAIPESALAAAFLIFGYLVMGIAYTAHHFALARKNRIQTPQGGIIGKTEITIFMIVCTLFPAGFPALAGLFGLLVFATGLMRAYAAIRMLKH
jgi:phosphatidylglycerophosphate synthase